MFPSWMFKVVPGYHPRENTLERNLESLRHYYKQGERSSQDQILGSIVILQYRELQDLQKLAAMRGFDIPGRHGQQKGFKINPGGRIVHTEDQGIGVIVAGDMEVLERNFLTPGGKVMSRKGELVGRLVLERFLPEKRNEEILLNLHGTGASIAEFPQDVEDRASIVGGAKAEGAQLLAGFGHAGVSQTEAEELITLYMQQRSPSCPPPLPPRPFQMRPSASTSSSPSDAASACKILILGQYNDLNTILAQFYFEVLRVWCANAHGSWLFHHVDSAGLYVTTDWRKSDNGRLENDYEKSFVNPGEEPLGPSAQYPRNFFRNASRSIEDKVSWPEAHGPPFERDRIVDRLRAHRTQGVELRTFSQYDFILTYHNRTFDALEELMRRLRDGESPSAYQQEKTVALPTILGFSCQTDIVTSDYKAMAGPLYNAIYNFSHAKLGLPWSGDTDQGLRTSFVQIRLEEEKERVVGEQDENLRRIEERSLCDLFIEKQSDMYGWVLAIVGQDGRRWKAEALVEELKKGKVIDWECA